MLRCLLKLKPVQYQQGTSIFSSSPNHRTLVLLQTYLKFSMAQDRNQRQEIQIVAENQEHPQSNKIKYDLNADYLSQPYQPTQIKLFYDQEEKPQPKQGFKSSVFQSQTQTQRQSQQNNGAPRQNQQDGSQKVRNKNVIIDRCRRAHSYRTLLELVNNHIDVFDDQYVQIIMKRLVRLHDDRQKSKSKGLGGIDSKSKQFRNYNKRDFSKLDSVSSRELNEEAEEEAFQQLLNFLKASIFNNTDKLGIDSLCVLFWSINKIQPLKKEKSLVSKILQQLKNRFENSNKVGDVNHINLSRLAYTLGQIGKVDQEALDSNGTISTSNFENSRAGTYQNQDIRQLFRVITEQINQQDLSQYNPYLLSVFMQTCQQLKCIDKDFLRGLQTQIQTNVKDFVPQDIVFCLSALTLIQSQNCLKAGFLNCCFDHIVQNHHNYQNTQLLAAFLYLAPHSTKLQSPINNEFRSNMPWNGFLRIIDDRISNNIDKIEPLAISFYIQGCVQCRHMNSQVASLISTMVRLRERQLGKRDLIWVCYGFARHFKLANRHQIRDLYFSVQNEVLRRIHQMSTSDLCVVLQSFTVHQIRIDKLVGKLMEQIKVKLREEPIKIGTVAQIVYCNAEMRYVDQQFLDLVAFQAPQISKSANVKIQDVSNLLWSMAILNQKDEALLRALKTQALRLSGTCEFQVDSTIDEPQDLFSETLNIPDTQQKAKKPGKIKIQHYCNIVWALAVLGQVIDNDFDHGFVQPYLRQIKPEQLLDMQKAQLYQSSLLNSITSLENGQEMYPEDELQDVQSEFEDFISDNNGLRKGLTFSQVQLRKLKQNSLFGESFMQELEEGWLHFSKLEYHHSSLSKEVREAVKRIEPRVISEYQTSEDLFSIDLALPQYRSPLTGTVHHKIAIEVDGPHHFTINPPFKYTGNSMARQRLMKFMGWRLATIPYFEYQRHKSDLQDKEDYVRAKLNQLDEYQEIT